MAGVSTPELAAAVSNAGGLGALGIGASTAVQARQMIEKTYALTSNRLTSTSFAIHPRSAIRGEKRGGCNIWHRSMETHFASQNNMQC